MVNNQRGKTRPNERKPIHLYYFSTEKTPSKVQWNTVGGGEDLDQVEWMETSRIRVFYFPPFSDFTGGLRKKKEWRNRRPPQAHWSVYKVNTFGVRTVHSTGGDEMAGCDVAEFFAHRSVLVTGGTGFLGKVLVEKLLRTCPDIAKIFLLIRAETSSDAGVRLQELISSEVGICPSLWN